MHKKKGQENENPKKPAYPFLTDFLELLPKKLNVTVTKEHPKNVPFVRWKYIKKMFKMPPDRFSYSMNSPEDTKSFREAILKSDYHNNKDILETNVCDSSHVPRISILNRKGSREIMNIQDVEQALQSEFPSLPFNIIYSFDGMSLLGQAHFFAETDILISSHGAQLTGIPFMPSCGSVLEVFPQGYYIPDFFQSLGFFSGLNFSNIYLGENMKEEVKSGMATVGSRRRARRKNLCIPVSAVVDEVKRMVDQRKHCCAKKQEH